jgi:flavodoxin
MIGNNIAVLHSHKPGNNFQVASIIASRLKCNLLAATDSPSLERYDVVIVVAANTGDEELSKTMESYLMNITLTDKHYLVVEIGNYFGLDNYYGCRQVVSGLLDRLGWKKLGEKTIDSTPSLDEEEVELWLSFVQENILRP